jgi:hypothetical protein
MRIPIHGCLSLYIVRVPGVLLLSNLPVCPTYDVLYVLHCSLYITLEIALFCGILSRNCLYTVLLVRKAMFMLVRLNRLVTLCTSGV